jgi:hypothetical protein
MTDADEHGTDVVLCSKDRADTLLAVNERRGGSARGAGILIPADEYALGASDGRSIRQHPDMTGQPETPWMGIALSVAEQHVRFLTQPAQSGEGGRRFPK